jgi:hypothetical protein
MKILIYTTHRTGSTSLGELLMRHYRCEYRREGFFKEKNFNKKLGTVDNIVIKLTPEEIEYNSIRGLFDKCIVLTREGVVEQAESRVYAEHIKEWFIPYNVDKDFFKTHKSEMDRMIPIIESENRILKECTDCLHITYEELYYGNGLEKIQDYLNTQMILKLDSSKKYRNRKNTNLI